MATPKLADGKRIVFTLQDSADGTDFADTTPTMTAYVEGANGEGGPARRVRFFLPPDVRRYFGIHMTTDADAESVETDGWLTTNLLF